MLPILKENSQIFKIFMRNFMDIYSQQISTIVLKINFVLYRLGKQFVTKEILVVLKVYGTENIVKTFHGIDMFLFAKSYFTTQKVV